MSAKIDKELWARFTGEALAGLASRGIHDQAGPPDRHGKIPIIPGAPAEAVAKRAVELGRAAAIAFQEAFTAQEPEKAKAKAA